MAKKKQKPFAERRYRVYCRDCGIGLNCNYLPEVPCTFCGADRVTVTDHKTMRTYHSLAEVKKEISN